MLLASRLVLTAYLGLGIGCLDDLRGLSLVIGRVDVGLVDVLDAVDIEVDDELLSIGPDITCTGMSWGMFEYSRLYC
jgi:hypothetical protein